MIHLHAQLEFDEKLYQGTLGLNQKINAQPECTLLDQYNYRIYVNKWPVTCACFPDYKLDSLDACSPSCKYLSCIKYVLIIRSRLCAFLETNLQPICKYNQPLFLHSEDISLGSSQSTMQRKNFGISLHEDE